MPLVEKVTHPFFRFVLIDIVLLILIILCKSGAIGRKVQNFMLFRQLSSYINCNIIVSFIRQRKNKVLKKLRRRSEGEAPPRGACDHTQKHTKIGSSPSLMSSVHIFYSSCDNHVGVALTLWLPPYHAATVNCTDCPA